MAKLSLCLTLFTSVVMICNGLKMSKRDTATPQYNYKDFAAWCDVTKNCCGKKQSPIALKTGGKYKPMKPFEFINYSNPPKSIKMTNNGHSIVVNYAGGTIMIEGGGLSNVYILDSLHFHWGKKDSRGSEHTVDGQTSVMEVHMPHYNSKYDSLASALASGDSDALAVFGLLFKVDKKSNEGMRNIAFGLNRVKYLNQSTQVTPFALRDFLPKDTSRFFRYNGSRTMPYCNEQVVWTVFQDKVPVTTEQLNHFRQVYTTAVGQNPKMTMSDNDRPLQALNGRQVIEVDTHRVDTDAKLAELVKLLRKSPDTLEF